MNCKPFQTVKLDWQRKPPCSAFFFAWLAFYQSSTKSTNQRHKTKPICLCKINGICFINRPPFHAARPRRFWGRGFESPPPPSDPRPAVNSTTAGRFIFAASTLKTRHLRLFFCPSLFVSRDAFFMRFLLFQRRWFSRLSLLQRSRDHYRIKRLCENLHLLSLGLFSSLCNLHKLPFLTSNCRRQGRLQEFTPLENARAWSGSNALSNSSIIPDVWR